jgi:Gluconate 2-dehydrogenase subunit 3
MRRRTALKQLGVLATAAMVLPSCVGKESVTQATIALNKISITGNQEKLLAAMAECLIPKTNTPGAGELNIHHFALRMIDDCTEAEDQKKFLKGLEQFQSAVEEKTGKSFEESTAEEQQNLLKDIESDKLVPTLKDGEQNSIKDFYDTYRGRTIQGYLGSEYVMTNVFGYNMIPGRYDGAVEINANTDIKTLLG